MPSFCKRYVHRNKRWRLLFYPDVSVVCEKPRFEDNEFDTLINPIVVVEVLSQSTETYDRGVKFTRYQQLESLQEYILIPFLIDLLSLAKQRL